MPKHITESDLQPQDSPANGWFIIETPGRYENTTTKGVHVVQVISPQTLASIADAGVPPEGIPIDKDHLSLDRNNSSEAMGWVRELAICTASGAVPNPNPNPNSLPAEAVSLAARIEWTALGLPLIQGKVYKHFSTVYPIDTPNPNPNPNSPVAVTPQRLAGLALTNQPNNAGAPAITNRASGSPYPSAGTNEEKTTNPSNNTDMNPEILKALGLPEGATDEEVLSAITELTQKAQDAEAAAQAAAESEADQVIEAEEKAANTELDADEKAECKEQILANRKHGVNYTHLLCNSKRKPAPASTGRRYEGKAPAGGLVANRTQDSREDKIANRASEICAQERQAGRKPNYWTAKAQAEREIGKESK